MSGAPAGFLVPLRSRSCDGHPVALTSLSQACEVTGAVGLFPVVDFALADIHSGNGCDGSLFFGSNSP